MALRRKGQYWYGETPSDVWDYFVQWTRDKPFVDEVTHWKQAVCPCGNATFNLFLHEGAGIALRVCGECGAEYRMLDHPDDARMRGGEEPDPPEFLCICECDEFEVIGVTAPFHPARPDTAKWFYLGVRCTECGCLGCCYESLERYLNSRQLLELV
jgi:hypothetical protein